MKITGNPYPSGSFCAKQNEPDKDDQNPISKLGERETLLKTTAGAGLAIGVRSLCYLWDEGFEFESIFKFAKKIVDKNKKGAKNKDLLYLGAFAALTAGFVGAIAAIYTLYKTPEIIYKGKINAFTKGKDMDVYIKSNNVEKELYNQMNDKAKVATPEEKDILSQQYLKLKAAKNQVPDSIVPNNA